MTRLFTDGAEMGDGLFWTTFAGEIFTDTPRTGTYCYHFDATGWGYKNIISTSEFYLKFGFRWGYHSGTVYWQSAAGTTLGNISVDWTTGNLNVHNGTTTIGTGIATIAQSTWYVIEAHVKIADNPDGIIQVKVDGSYKLDYLGDTKPGADTTVGRIYVTGWSIDLDDLALNDTTNDDGLNDNGWCGAGKVIKLTPSGSGTLNDWVNNSNTSGSSNYLFVDEYPNDGDTTYVRASGSSTGAKDRYAMSNFTIPTNASVKRIFSQASIKKGNTLDTYVKIGYLPLGGTDQVSGSVALTTSYTIITGTSASLNPATGIKWTQDDINALEYTSEVA
jgi:hypothetical protein